MLSGGTKAEEKNLGSRLNSMTFYLASIDCCVGFRKNAAKEDRAIGNHFHGFSSSTEARRRLCGQTDQRSWILLDS